MIWLSIVAFVVSVLAVAMNIICWRDEIRQRRLVDDDWWGDDKKEEKEQHPIEDNINYTLKNTMRAPLTQGMMIRNTQEAFSKEQQRWERNKWRMKTNRYKTNNRKY